jgi:glycine cleavage system H protein
LYPANLKYSKEHEWVKADGNIATIGITAHAQNELGDIVYVELPKVGAKFNTMQEFGVVESVKTVSTLYCPVAGEVTEVNANITAKPETINTDPHGQGWMLKLKMANLSDLDKLLSSSDYEALIKK